jgi:hypothetical protein
MRATEAPFHVNCDAHAEPGDNLRSGQGRGSPGNTVLRRKGTRRRCQTEWGPFGQRPLRPGVGRGRWGAWPLGRAFPPQALRRRRGWQLDRRRYACRGRPGGLRLHPDGVTRGARLQGDPVSGRGGGPKHRGHAGGDPARLRGEDGWRVESWSVTGLPECARMGGA